MTSISAAASARVSNLRFGDVHTLIWSLERGLDAAPLWATFDMMLRRGAATDVLDLGVLLPSCEASRCAAGERRLWGLLSAAAPLRRDMQEVVAGATQHERNPAAYICKLTVGGDFAGAQVARHGGHAQHKLAMLVQHVEAVLSSGPNAATDVLDAIVDFSLKKFNYWLKVAADLKGQLIDYAVDHAGMPRHRTRLELGAYVGYSSLRLAGATATRGSEWRVTSLEVEPLHVCVARHMLNLGAHAALGEVRTGQAKDLLPRVADELGALSLGLTFMDHRGTRFHDELYLCERMHMAAPRMDTICDNVLHPGAPVFLWEETQPGASRVAAVWSLPEFGGDGRIEDWMAFERYEPRTPGNRQWCYPQYPAAAEALPDADHGDAMIAAATVR
eukprot:NODE_9201_length_1440_cov_4.220107.p1 GENE.NODE_9201_length_1440_cov_4.220107~~NODE_9201_length_1440_cov_4.220107.p1  ORF type:complete len:413 (+),score=147.71 NODE_9201_length_1440_cov_4.220107:75-1241(+)